MSESNNLTKIRNIPPVKYALSEHSVVSIL